MITDTINRMSLLKKRRLWEKISEFHLCQIIRKCLSPQDQDEFFREEAKYISSTQEGLDGEDCNMEAYLQTEIMRDNLDLRKRVLMRFLRLRQTMYLDREASTRILATSCFAPSNIKDTVPNVEKGCTPQDKVMKIGEKLRNSLCALCCDKRHNFDSMYFCMRFRNLSLG